jgi:hypothetical protein
MRHDFLGNGSGAGGGGFLARQVEITFLAAPGRGQRKRGN